MKKQKIVLRFVKKIQFFIIISAIFLPVTISKAYDLEQAQFFEGDWIVPVDNITIGKNCYVGTNANLSIYGTLKLTNCTFELNSTFGKILAAENASLEIVNSTIISIYQSELILRGYARIENCWIENLELQIYSNMVNLTNTTITGSDGYGVMIKNCSPRLQNNTICANSKGGIYSISASARILENRIINNGIGLIAAKSNDVVVGNNISNNRGYGVTLKNNSTVKLENNSIFSNNHLGIFLNRSYGTIKNNIIENNSWGIELLDSRAEFENNSFLFNRNGSIIQKRTLRIDVLNGNNEYVEDVGIAITNVDGTKFLGGVINGSVTLTLPEYEITEGKIITHSPYSVYYKKGGVYDTEIIVLNKSRTVKLKLLADVVIKNIFVPAEILPNQDTTIKVELHNPSSIKISARVDISVDSVPLYDYIISFTENSGIAVDLVWCSREGLHKIEVWIDQDNLVEERNETNNYEFRMIEVSKLITPEEKQEYFQYALLSLIISLLGLAVFLICRRKH